MEAEIPARAVLTSANMAFRRLRESDKDSIYRHALMAIREFPENDPIKAVVSEAFRNATRDSVVKFMLATHAAMIWEELLGPAVLRLLQDAEGHATFYAACRTCKTAYAKMPPPDKTVVDSYMEKTSRRKFLKHAGSYTAAVALGAEVALPVIQGNHEIKPLKLGRMAIEGAVALALGYASRPESMRQDMARLMQALTPIIENEMGIRSGGMNR